MFCAAPPSSVLVEIMATRAPLGLAYSVTVGLSFVSAPLTLVVHFALAVYYCFDHLGGKV